MIPWSQTYTPYALALHYLSRIQRRIDQYNKDKHIWDYHCASELIYEKSITLKVEKCK